MNNQPPTHFTRLLLEPGGGMRAVCTCGFLGSQVYEQIAAWNQAAEHELQQPTTLKEQQ